MVARPLKRRCRRDERGASLVELAIVLPFFLLLVFGMIDFGVAFADYQNVRSGVREAARLGVVDDINAAPSCKIDGTTVSPPATPTTSTDATNALVCKTKDRIGLDDDDVRVRIVVSGSQIGDRIKVCASFPVSALTGLTASFLSNKTLTSAVTMRLEQVPPFTSYSEPGTTC
jgi:Flp pilus assembly protein TadG